MAAPSSLIHEAASSKRTTISLTCPVSQKEVGKGFLLTTFSPAYPSHQKNAVGSSSPVGARLGGWGSSAGNWALVAWVLLLMSLCLFDSCCWRSLLCGRKHVLILPFCGMRRLAHWRHSKQNRLHSDPVYLTPVPKGLWAAYNFGLYFPDVSLFCLKV